MTLTHLLWESPAAGSPSDCLGDIDTILSYAEVGERVRAFAEQLHELGIGKGDVIAVMLRNRIEFAVIVFAAWYLGAGVTPINPAFTERELRYQLDDSRAVLFLTEPQPSHAALLATDPETVPLITTDQMRLQASASFLLPVTCAEQIALLVYTSGSTGTPKGVMLDHSNLSAMSLQWTRHVEMTAADRALLILPLFHVNAICLSWLAPLSVGGSTILLDRADPERLLAAIERFRPSYFSTVPAILARLLELPSHESADTSSVRFVLCGAAPVSKELLVQSAERFGLHIIEGYGLTEATCASACNPLRGKQKLGSVGPVLSGQHIRITDEEGHSVPPGTRGEVRISGPTVMRGYLGLDETTTNTIVDGWLRTGDIGVLDADGYLSIVDRMKDMIIRGGENLYPKEIEAHLSTHASVLEAAVIGVAHEIFGEVPVAYVVLHPDANTTANELVAHCAAGLMKIKVPAQIFILDTLPRNPVGKLDKPELRRRTLPVDVPTLSRYTATVR